MLLSKLTIQNIGPFAEPTEIQFEPDVTVLTGANDCGKTSVLNAIELVCGMKGNERVLQEHEVNLDRIGHSNTSWKKDPEISCEVLFDLTDLSGNHVESNLGPDGQLSLLCSLSPECRRIGEPKFRNAKEGGWSTGGGVSIKSFPSVIRLPMTEPIGTVIDLGSPNSSEHEFLRAAFGPSFNFEKYSSLSDPAFYTAISKAKGDTNAKLKQLLPASISLEFDFQTVQGNREKLSVQLRDNHSGHTPLEVRGSGIQRLVSLMGALLAHDLSDSHYIILLDEPENSLHADAQHSFRGVLEKLAEKPNVQVVYATHSPSMINPIRTASLRVMRRTNSNSIATSIVEHRPIDENFLSVRSSLGITPADSLLYAPVTLIVEGPSEVIGLPIILGRLWQKGVEGFEDVERLLTQVHFLDGCGDSFDYLCKIAVSQGAKPVVFLDGDKAGSRLNKLKKRFPDVPIVLLEGRSEFEEIVPQEAYFQSVSEVMSEFSDEAKEQLQASRYQEWESANSLPEKMAFSKRVDRWVQDTVGLSLEKPLVMKKVLQETPLDDVKKNALMKLLDAIRDQLSS